MREQRPVTPQQRAVGELIAQGFEGPEIAEKLGISLSTVEMHRAGLYQRIGVRNAVGLTHFALARGWVHNMFAGRGRPPKPRE